MASMVDLYFDDCMNRFWLVDDSSVDMILCDQPYGTTACAWDSVLSLPEVWKEYERIIKPHGAIVLTCAQPFTAALLMSKPEWYRHEWIWDKGRASGFYNAKHMPMQRHEHILVFGKESPQYYPFMIPRLDSAGRIVPVKGRIASQANTYGEMKADGKTRVYTHLYPQTILEYPKPTPSVHPTQKPVELLEYLLRTYTHRGAVVLDNCMGSGSTGEACMNIDRSFIGMEKDERWFAYAKDRIEQAQARAARLQASWFPGMDGTKYEHEWPEGCITIEEELAPALGY